MTKEPNNNEEEKLPELSIFEELEVFLPGAIKGRVRITKSAPVAGELIRARNGVFLVPEEDNRGGGLGSIYVTSLPADVTRGIFGRTVKVAGIYENGRLAIEAVALDGEPFED